ncbi:MAG TPA: hypothetical protein VFZ27_05300 [Terriglobia bacterium]|nr:hypothetical protein [Terriglobia bacterium]
MRTSDARKFPIFRGLSRLIYLLAVLVLVSNLPADPKKGQDKPGSGQATSGHVNASLWSAPTDIRHRNLFFGPGGKEHQPDTVFTFVKEDLDGTSPKFSVRDQDGTKWKVKLGPEAQPETVATRLIWAVGYRADEDYFLPRFHVQGMPEHLQRGQKWVGPGGEIRGGRLERDIKGQKKVGQWNWESNPFIGTRELNGLRVMMALVNNWDVKNQNNAVYDEDAPSDNSEGGRRVVYLVSDVGDSFGSGGRGWLHMKSAGNLTAYKGSRFIGKVGPEYVNFNLPAKPPLLFFLNLPEFIVRLQMGQVCRYVPRADVRWVGHLLAQLSPEQIDDAFRAAGYSPADAESYAKAVLERISKLNDL